MFNYANHALHLYYTSAEDASEFIHKCAKKIISHSQNIEFVFEDESSVICKIEKDKISEMVIRK